MVIDPNSLEAATASVPPMTWDRWCALSPAERAKRVDSSMLHPQLSGLEGHKVRVSPPYVTMSGRNLSVFRVGRTTGWRPVHLAIRRRGQFGSSEVVDAKEPFTSVIRLD